MKKTLFTSVAVAALVFGIGTSQAIAKTPNNFRSNQFGHPMWQFSERNFTPRNPVANGMCMEKRGGKGAFDFDVLGTVSSVNADAKTITLKDADGKEIVVHVNPFTKLRAKPADAQKTDKKRNGSNEVALDDVKAGDWIAVKKIDTETKAIEAAKIIVVKD